MTTNSNDSGNQEDREASEEDVDSEIAEAVTDGGQPLALEERLDTGSKCGVMCRRTSINILPSLHFQPVPQHVRRSMLGKHGILGSLTASFPSSTEVVTHTRDGMDSVSDQRTERIIVEATRFSRKSM